MKLPLSCISIGAGPFAVIEPLPRGLVDVSRAQAQSPLADKLVVPDLRVVAEGEKQTSIGRARGRIGIHGLL